MRRMATYRTRCGEVRAWSRPLGDDSEARCDEIGGLVHHARLDVRGGQVVGPVRFPVLRVGRIADRVVAVAQLYGAFLIERVEVRDGSDPGNPVAEQRNRGDLLIDARR